MKFPGNRTKRSCFYLLITAITLAPLQLAAQSEDQLKPHSKVAAVPNEAALWWMNTQHERGMRGSGSIRTVVYRNADGSGGWTDYGYLSIDSQVPIDLLHAGGRVPFEGRDVLAVEGTFTDPNGTSSPVATLIILGGYEDIDSLAPIAANDSPQQVSEILSMTTSTLTGMPIEQLKPDNTPPPDLGGGGEACIENCNAQQILDYSACGSTLALCATAAVAAWGICAAACPLSGPGVLACELACLGGFLIAEGICIGNNLICTKHADDTRDLCIANCCVLWDPERSPAL